MEKKISPLIIIFSILITQIFSQQTLASSLSTCKPTYCNVTGPEIRFPFRVPARQPEQCGYPGGFDLTCNSRNQTVLTLPGSGRFVVTKILYSSQTIFVNPEFCLPGRIYNFSLANTPFEDGIYMHSYTFFNCSGPIDLEFPAVTFRCLSTGNHTVIALPTAFTSPGDVPTACRNVSVLQVPVRRYGDLRVELALMWFTPYCRDCEGEGGTCGLMSDGELGCSATVSHGLPRSAKYGIIMGVGIPALVCFIGLLCYTAAKVRGYIQRPNRSIDLFSITLTPHPNTLTGLDKPTIDSYPKTVLGESGRLPKPSDNTCPICLSDYQPKETLRMIPECNHYFHADCVDEWLKLNATCPVCRNTPESSSLITPCSTASSPSSTVSSRRNF